MNISVWANHSRKVNSLICAVTVGQIVYIWSIYILHLVWWSKSIYEYDQYIMNWYIDDVHVTIVHDQPINSIYPYKVQGTRWQLCSDFMVLTACAPLMGARWLQPARVHGWLQPAIDALIGNYIFISTSNTMKSSPVGISFQHWILHSRFD